MGAPYDIHAFVQTSAIDRLEMYASLLERGEKVHWAYLSQIIQDVELLVLRETLVSFELTPRYTG